MLKALKEFFSQKVLPVFRKRSGKLFCFLSRPSVLSVILLIAGALFKMAYAVRVPYNISDHDLGAIRIERPDTNHIGYMQYLERYRKLPDLSPMENWGMLHPPLFHIIGAAFIHANNAGRSIPKIQASMEQLQLLNMFFACLISFYCFAFIKAAGVKENLLPAAAAFFGFFPSFFHIGAALNNDCLMTLFVVMGFYYAACWNKHKTAANMLKITVCFILGMLAKSSACLAVPAVFCVFVCAFAETARKNKETEQCVNNCSAGNAESTGGIKGTDGNLSGTGGNIEQSVKENHAGARRIAVHAALFLALFLSAGFSWLIREHIKFGMPFNYMNDASVYAWQDVSTCPWHKRLFVPAWQQLAVIPFNDGRPDLSCNIWGELLLTMNFDEFKLYSESIVFSAGAVLMLWNSIALAISGIYGMCRMFLMKSIELRRKAFAALSFFLPFAAFIYMCFKYQHRACMNFRLISYLPLPAAAGTALYLSRSITAGLFEKLIKCFCYSYAALSAVLFAVWG